MQDFFWNGFADEIEKLSAMAPGAQIWAPKALSMQRAARSARAVAPTTDEILHASRRAAMRGEEPARNLAAKGYAPTRGGGHYNNTPGWSPGGDSFWQRFQT